MQHGANPTATCATEPIVPYFASQELRSCREKPLHPSVPDQHECVEPLYACSTAPLTTLGLTELFDLHLATKDCTHGTYTNCRTDLDAVAVRYSKAVSKTTIRRQKATVRWLALRLTSASHGTAS